MVALFSKNAYNVLGLDSSASQKDINKQAKEIQARLWNDEVPEYETDLGISGLNRDEANVKEAVQKLSSPTKRIPEYFFWFEIESERDEKALSLLRQEKYDDALELWQAHADRNFTAKRNLAVASSLLLNGTGFKKYLTLSVKAWEDITKSDKFWQHFEKVYALNDEIGTSKDAIEGFRKNVVDYLSDFYTDVSQAKKDNSFYALFSKTFGIKGQKLQDTVLAPIFEDINDTAQKLRNLNISEDNIISPQEVMAVKRLVKRLQDNFQKLKDLGLYDDSHSKIMRDKAAEAIRVVSLDLFNNLNESSKSIALLKVAASIAGTSSLIAKLNKDTTDARQMVSQEKVIQPINDLMGKEKYSEALDLIIEGKEKHKNDKQLQEYFDKRTQWCVTAIASEHFVETKKLFEAGDYEQAAPRFKNVHDFIDQYIEVFDFNNSALQNVLNELRHMMSDARPDLLQQVDQYRQNVIDKAGYNADEQFESTILIMLIDSIIYGRLSEIMPEIKKRNHRQRIKNVIWWIVIIGFFLIVGGAFNGGSDDDSSSSGSSSSSSSSSCNSELSSLQSEIDSIESEMNSYKSSGDADSYNNLVPRQNELVNSYNSKLAECQ